MSSFSQSDQLVVLGQNIHTEKAKDHESLWYGLLQQTTVR